MVNVENLKISVLVDAGSCKRRNVRYSRPMLGEILGDLQPQYGASISYALCTPKYAQFILDTMRKKLRGPILMRSGDEMVHCDSNDHLPANRCGSPGVISQPVP